jgi:hypothetical protein
MAKKRRLRKTGILSPKVVEAPREDTQAAPEPVKVEEKKVEPEPVKVKKEKPIRRWLKNSSDKE